MATVASWLVSLNARTQQYDAAVSRSARVTGDFERKVKGINVTTAGWGTTQMGMAKQIVGVAAGVAAINALFRDGADAVHQMTVEGRQWGEVWPNIVETRLEAMKSIPIAGPLGSALSDWISQVEIARKVADTIREFMPAASPLGDWIASNAEALKREKDLASSRKNLAAATEQQIALEQMLADAQSRFDMAGAHTEAEKSAVRLEKELREIEQRYKGIAAVLAAAFGPDQRQEFMRLQAILAESSRLEEDAARLENTPKAERFNPPNFPKERRFFDLASQGNRIPGPGTQAARDAAEKAAIEAAKDGKERTRLMRQQRDLTQKLVNQLTFVPGNI